MRRETARAKTFRLRLGEPSVHLAGQHYVIRLTAPDGYTAARSYSIASAPDGSHEVEFTIERLDGGEVSMFLHDDVVPGDELEVRGPIGGWFVWRGDIPRTAAPSPAAQAAHTATRVRRRSWDPPCGRIIAATL